MQLVIDSCMRLLTEFLINLSGECGKKVDDTSLPLPQGTS